MFISAGNLIKFEGVTSSGIYNYSRNPLYIGSFFIGSGACVIGMDIFFSIFFIIAYPLLYLQTIKKEERYLLNRYGADYEKYIRTVPRFLSGQLNIGEILKGSSPFLAVKNRELVSVLGVVTVLAMMAAKMMY